MANKKVVKETLEEVVNETLEEVVNETPEEIVAEEVVAEEKVADNTLTLSRPADYNEGYHREPEIVKEGSFTIINY